MGRDADTFNRVRRRQVKRWLGAGKRDPSAGQRPSAGKFKGEKQSSFGIVANAGIFQSGFYLLSDSMFREHFGGKYQE